MHELGRIRNAMGISRAIQGEAGEVGFAACNVGEGGVAEEEGGVRYVVCVGVLEDGEVGAAGAAVGVVGADPGYGADGALGEDVLVPVLVRGVGVLGSG